MEQRRLRLGDILDDYCPRERRVTNHAVVAMVEETSSRPAVRPATPNTPTRAARRRAGRRRKRRRRSTRKSWPASRTPTLPARRVRGASTDEPIEARRCRSQPGVRRRSADDRVPARPRAVVDRRRRGCRESRPDDRGADAARRRDRRRARRQTSIDHARCRGRPGPSSADSRDAAAYRKARRKRGPPDFTIRQPAAAERREPAATSAGGGPVAATIVARPIVAVVAGLPGKARAATAIGAGNRRQCARPSRQRFAAARRAGPGKARGRGAARAAASAASSSRARAAGAGSARGRSLLKLFCHLLGLCA